MAAEPQKPRTKVEPSPPGTSAKETPAQGKATASAAPPPTSGDQRRKIYEFIRGLHATHLLAFGQESGAFAHVRNYEPHGIGVRELADHLGWNPEYTQFFLEGAFSLGVLELASEAGVTPRSRYRFAAHMADLLADDTTSAYMGDSPRYHVLAAQDYRRLADLFRTGKTFPYALHGEEFLRAAAMVTRSLPHRVIQGILPRMPELSARLEAGAHLLDVGCGAGWAVVLVAERFPRCRVVGIDAEPNVISMAKTLITMRQLTQRAEARIVRGEEIDYEAEFDVATFFLVLHAIPPRQKAVALAHAARALKRGGFLLIVDEAYPDSAKEFDDPDRQLPVISQWLEGPWGHRLSSRAEHRTLLAEAGLRVRREVDEGRYYAVLAEKP